MRFAKSLLGVVSIFGLVATATPATAAVGAIPVVIASVPHSRFTYVLEAAPSGCGHTFCLWFSRISDPPAPTANRTLPSLHPLGGQPTGNLESLQFTSRNDGYLWAKEGRASTLYVTTDGARSWHRSATTSTRLPVHSFTVTLGHIYFVTGLCSGMGLCHRFRLHSAGASGRGWVSRPLTLDPNTTGVGLGAIGSDLWIQEPTSTGGVRVLFSHNSGRTFTKWNTNIYGAPTGCVMTPSSPTTLWAECPTGMNYEFEVSVDGGHHWRVIDTGGLIASTAGWAFDPLSARVAFIDVGKDAASPGADLLRASPSGKTTVVGGLRCSIDYGLDFITSTLGLADCQVTSRRETTMILVTSNGGHTWIPRH